MLETKIVLHLSHTQTYHLTTLESGMTDNVIGSFLLPVNEMILANVDVYFNFPEFPLIDRVKIM